ncbi:hypothetical protein PQX77_012849 [Marasmius sp. AFHP31]|nr:hypothetical protein PQX77_012849 [Marasmius sp. AFHP31]
METKTTTESRRLEASLRGLADALRATDSEHPLLEVAQDASYLTTDLITKDRGHSTNNKDYRESYKVVRDIVKLSENQQTIPEPTGLRCQLALIKSKQKCNKLGRELKREFKNTSAAPQYKRENGLILTGGLVSVISGVDALPSVPTLRGNTEEIANLLYLVTRFFKDLSPVKIDTISGPFRAIIRH